MTDGGVHTFKTINSSKYNRHWTKKHLRPRPDQEHLNNLWVYALAKKAPGTAYYEAKKKREEEIQVEIHQMPVDVVADGEDADPEPTRSSGSERIEMMPLSPHEGKSYFKCINVKNVRTNKFKCLKQENCSTNKCRISISYKEMLCYLL